MGNVHKLSDLETVQTREWSRGYHDGYNGKPTEKVNQAPQYDLGYEVGATDRIEDNQAILNGDFDGLSDSEREFLYGNERDRI